MEPGGAQRAIYRLAQRPWGPQLLRLFTSQARFAAALVAGFHDPSRLDPRLIDRLWTLSRHNGNPTASIARIRAQTIEPELNARLREMDIPTLLLWGADDPVFLPALAKDFGPRSTLILYEKCGHCPMIEAAEASAHDLAAFVGP
jgi:pimeloyl-ACP methyl ester carboxylesterase